MLWPDAKGPLLILQPLYLDASGVLFDILNSRLLMQGMCPGQEVVSAAGPEVSSRQGAGTMQVQQCIARHLQAIPCALTGGTGPCNQCSGHLVYIALCTLCTRAHACLVPILAAVKHGLLAAWSYLTERLGALRIL